MSDGNVPDSTRAEDLMSWLDSPDGRMVMTTHPDRAALVLASAQVHATLALVEQQRIATVALLTAQGLVKPDDQRRTEMLKALGLS